MKDKLLSVTIDDCEVQTFRSGGPGGQHQNKTESGVRIIHRPSGAVGESRTQRSQWQNKRYAWSRLAETEEFKKWVRLQAAKRSGRSVEDVVNEQMHPSNIKVEIQENGKWVESAL